jgi:hypothetical protein
MTLQENSYEEFLKKRKNVVVLDVTPLDSCKNWRFAGTYRLHFQG